MDSYVEEEQVDNISQNEKFSDSNIKIERYGNKLKHSFYVNKLFFPYIVGSKNNVRQKIEIQTRTSVHVPKIGQDGDIVIVGSNHNEILSAKNQIDLIVKASKEKVRFTHFLSIPLNVNDIIENFNSFKSDVIEKYGEDITGINEIIFQRPNKLHLTLGMLTLLDEGERKQAIQTLMDCEQDVIKPFIEKHGLFTIEIKGVDCMNDNPSAVKVLYGTVLTENHILQELSNQIVDYFADKELMPKRTKDVKLHATFMNTTYRRKIKNKLTMGRNMYKPFDATQIINEYKDTLFGKTILKEIHLSQLNTSTETNYYAAAAKITLSKEQQ